MKEVIASRMQEAYFGFQHFFRETFHAIFSHSFKHKVGNELAVVLPGSTYAALSSAWSKRKGRLRLLAQFHFGGKNRKGEGRSEKEWRAEKEKGNRLCSEISYGLANTAMGYENRWHTWSICLSVYPWTTVAHVLSKFIHLCDVR